MGRYAAVAGASTACFNLRQHAAWLPLSTAPWKYPGAVSHVTLLLPLACRVASARAVAAARGWQLGAEDCEQLVKCMASHLAGLLDLAASNLDQVSSGEPAGVRAPLPSGGHCRERCCPSTPLLCQHERRKCHHRLVQPPASSPCAVRAYQMCRRLWCLPCLHRGSWLPADLPVGVELLQHNLTCLLAVCGAARSLVELLSAFDEANCMRSGGLAGQRLWRDTRLQLFSPAQQAAMLLCGSMETAMHSILMAEGAPRGSTQAGAGAPTLGPASMQIVGQAARWLVALLSVVYEVRV